MIFENDSSIDKNLLELVKKIKRHSKENPVIRLLKEQHSWIVTVPENWISSGINITYNELNKKPYRVWWEVWGVDSTSEDSSADRHIIMDVEISTSKDVIDTLLLMRYSHFGIPKEVLDFIANKMKVVSLETALKSIAKETDLYLTIEQIEILGITSQRGSIIGKKFGI